MALAKAIIPEQIKITVKIVAGPHSGDIFIIEKDSFSIGRGAENDIILVNDPKLSRNHIKAALVEADIQIENLSSRNPILFKGKIENNVKIKPDDKIKIGDTEIEMVWDATALEKTKMADNTAQLTFTSLTSVTTLTPPAPHRPTSATSPPPTSFTPQSPSFNPSVSLTPQTPQIPRPPLASVVERQQIQTKPESKNSSSVIIKPVSTGSLSSLSSEKVKKALKKQYQGKDFLKEKKIPVLIGGLFLFLVLVFTLSGEKKVKKTSLLKDTHQINAELAKSSQHIENYIKEKKLQEDGRMDRIYESAQSYYIKGFRDYRQGQYSRALLSFQAALSFDPNHVLAKKYLLQSVKKHSELVQFNLDQAKRYRDKNNYRLCTSAAKQVIIMALRKDQTDPYYKEGKLLFDECGILSKGRF